MKLLFILLISFNCSAQYGALKQHKVSLAFTALQGFADGFRDASMFGRVKYGRWYNSSLDSYKLKYKNGDYTQGAAYFGSTSVFVMFTDAPHAANSLSHISGEFAKVYMPNMEGTTFWQKFKVVMLYSIVRGICHNIINDQVFKRR